MAIQEYDVLIIGAGLSGIGAACHLRQQCPDKSFAILERRQDLGGTWDLFRYPGIRSDSDMFTFGYKFKPWIGHQVLADGASIKKYIKEAAAEHDVLKQIQYGLKLSHARWSSRTRRWTVEVLDESTQEKKQYRCRFLLGATGYYNYDKGFQPNFPKQEAFDGEIVHPQHWPQDLDVRGKKVVVIGSGATAITLVPNLVKQGAQVSMLQRTPTYVMSLPEIDPVSSRLRHFLPEKLLYKVSRQRNIALQRSLYAACRRWPQRMRKVIIAATRKQLGPNVDAKHFSPDYAPWDQRLCVVPNGDLFKCLRRGQASIHTDTIQAFESNGLRLNSGEFLETDLVISATGLNIQLLGGAQLEVDGQAVQPSQHMVYKGVMLEGVPNAALIVGYTNASWTLKADIASNYICRLLKYMDRYAYDVAVPRDYDNQSTDETVMGGLEAGYVKRAENELPRQGKTAPWALMNNYYADARELNHGSIDDGVLLFSNQEEAMVGKNPIPANA